MISKDDRTIKILEHSEETIEKFKSQASELTNDYLTELLTFTNEADSLYKTSQNQRLHVEILIMKLCSVGAQKKKSKYLEAPILAPLTDKINPDISIENPKEDVEKQVLPITGTSINTIQENVKTEIIRPKTSLSSKKRFTTASITGIRKKINDDLNAPLKDDKKQYISSSRFSQTLLMEKWNQFAELRKKEGKMGLYITMTKTKPVLNDDFSIVFEIDSEVQKIEFQTESQLLLDFLRSELKNGLIQLNLQISESDNPKLTQLTSKERFFQMAEENPDLHNFKDVFDLDIEY